MKIFIKKALLLLFLIIILIPCQIQAANPDPATAGLGITAQEGYETIPASDIPTMIGRVVGVALSFIGIIFFVLMIYAGFSWMLARGNESEVQKAKSLIEAAIVGLVIVLSAYAITSFIGGELLR